MVTREFALNIVVGDPLAVSPAFFFLVNPSSGKVLGLKDGNCDPFTPIEVQDRIFGRNSDRQQYALTDDGGLKNKACSVCVLTNK